MNNLCPMFELEWEEMNHLNELALSVNNFSQGQSYIATCRENKIGIQFFVTFFFSSQGTVYDCWHMLLTFFFFFLMNKNFIHKTKTELQIGYKSLILNDNLKTGRAETSIKDPKTLFANTYLCYLVFVLSAIWVYIYRQCKLSFLVDSSMNSLVNEAQDFGLSESGKSQSQVQVFQVLEVRLGGPNPSFNIFQFLTSCCFMALSVSQRLWWHLKVKTANYLILHYS